MISVVIPTLNEADRLTGVIAALRSQGEGCEVIVADGGSADGTAQRAAVLGAKVVVNPPSRGRQLAEGAAAASGDILLFLHADSRFPSGGLAAIEEVLERGPPVLGGNFRLLFDGDSDFSRWLTVFYARLRACGLYYGDSGIFVRRNVYRALGGIRPIALMEDYDFSRRLERAGETCCIESPPLTTSSRRFEDRSRGAIFCGWIWIHLLYHMGVSPERLAWLYDSGRRARRATIHEMKDRP